MAFITDLIWRYCDRTISASGDMPELGTVDAGGTDSTIVADDFAQADDYWNGAIMKHLTGANAGLYSSVKDWDLGTTTFTLDRDAAVTPGVGDTFRVILGGKNVSGLDIDGMTKTQPSNITGVTIDYASYYNTAGNALLDFLNATTSLSWRAPGGAAGAIVTVSADGTYDLFSSDGSGYAQVTVVSASLPGSDQADTIVLTQPENLVLPSFIGVETFAGNVNYRAIGLHNAHATDSILSIEVFTEAPVEGIADTTLVTAVTIAADTIQFTSATDLPTSGWILNTTKDDCRYYYGLTGDTANTFDSGAGLRGYTAAAWDIADVVKLMSDCDIAVDAAPYEDPSSETTAPGALTFTTSQGEADSLSIGTLTAGQNVIIWERITVLEEAHPRSDAVCRLRAVAQVDEG